MKIERTFVFAEELRCGLFIYRLRDDLNTSPPKKWRFAPDVKGALYIRLETDDMKYVAGLEVKVQPYFVAVTFIVALANRDDRLINGKLKGMKKNEELQLGEHPSRETEDVRFLQKYNDSLWVKAPPNNPVNTDNVYIPCRDIKGKPEWPELSPGYRSRLQEVLLDKIPKRRAAGGKPLRHSSVPNITLHICPVTTGSEMLLDARLKLYREKAAEKPGRKDYLDKLLLDKKETESVLELLVGKLTDEYQNTNVTYKVKVDRDANMKAQSLMRISTDPFNLYHTYVEKEDWHKYMVWLGARNGLPAIRNFPEEQRTHMSDVVRVLLKRDEWVERLAEAVYAETALMRRTPASNSAPIEDIDKGDSIELESLRDAPPVAEDNPADEVGPNGADLTEYEDEDEDDGNDNGKHQVVELGDQNLDFSKPLWRANKQQMPRLRIMDQWIKGHFKVDDYRRALLSQIETQKILRAVGRRTGLPGQAAVMGYISTNQIAREMGWHMGKKGSGGKKKPETKTDSMVLENQPNKDGKLDGPGWVSEWLHLSAFSFGGFDGETGSHTTSQVPENLVFGTGECNSFMTRYEMAWQELFRGEDELEYDHRRNNPSYKTGTLEILSNHCDHDCVIEYDILGKGQDGDDVYVADKFDLSRDEANDVLDGTADGPDDPVRFIQGMVDNKFTSKTCARSLRKICRQNPFISLRIHYKLHMNERSWLLAGNVRGQFDFYPFRRQLYHVAEADLDDLLFDLLKKFAKEDIKEASVDATDATQIQAAKHPLEEILHQHRISLATGRPPQVIQEPEKGGFDVETAKRKFEEFIKKPGGKIKRTWGRDIEDNNKSPPDSGVDLDNNENSADVLDGEQFKRKKALKTEESHNSASNEGRIEEEPASPTSYPQHQDITLPNIAQNYQNNLFQGFPNGFGSNFGNITDNDQASPGILEEYDSGY